MPRFGNMSPHDQDPERAQLVQSYMVLTAKQTSVRRRLSSPPSMSRESSTSGTSDLDPVSEAQVTPATRPSWRHSTPSSSRHSQSSSKSSSPRAQVVRRPSVAPIFETHEEHDIDSDEGKLTDINRRIKSVLSDLLSCESVKNDERMRAWVQTRLDSQQSPTRPAFHSTMSSAFTPAHRRSSSSASSSSSTTYSSSGWNPHYTDGTSYADPERPLVRKLSI